MMDSFSSINSMIIHRFTGQITIVQEPSSLLIPVNEAGVFSCKAVCNTTCFGVWIINGSYLQDGTEARRQLESQGFNLSIPPQWNESLREYTIKLLVNASKPVNNSDIQCASSPYGIDFNLNVISKSAKLLVLSSKLRSHNNNDVLSEINILFQIHQYPPTPNLKATQHISFSCGLRLTFGLVTEYNTTTSHLPTKVTKVSAIIE